MTLEALIALSRDGFIAGPGESESDFEKRVAYCKNLHTELETSTTEETIEAHTITKRWFDITPTWVPCVFSNHQLSLWHGGCAWIFQKDDKTPTGAFLQLRKTFKKNKMFLGIYRRNEFIAHELCHVGRMMFQEPRFEEVIAYQSASSSFQRFFGPLIRSSFEAILFTLILMMIVLIDVMILMTGSFAFYQQLMWLKLLPFGLVFLALVRLVWTQFKFQRCRQKLKEVLSSDEKISAVIFRLTDNEIDQFGSMTPGEIRGHAENAAIHELRWKQISVYFLDIKPNSH